MLNTVVLGIILKSKYGYQHFLDNLVTAHFSTQLQRCQYPGNMNPGYQTKFSMTALGSH